MEPAGTSDGDAGYRLRELDTADIAAVQRFFEATRDFWIVNGEGPRPDSTDRVRRPAPTGMAYRKMPLLGFTAPAR
jgi:hypothetical protein